MAQTRQVVLANADTMKAPAGVAPHLVSGLTEGRRPKGIVPDNPIGKCASPSR